MAQSVLLVQGLLHVLVDGDGAGAGVRSLLRAKSESRSVFSGARRVRGLAPGGRAWFRSGRCFATPYAHELCFV